MSDKKAEYDQIKDLYFFSDLYKFLRDSSGIAITLCYLILILSSMAYLFVLYAEFDVAIIKLLTLEDILATPIKNPDIILVVTVIICLFYFADMANRYNARLHLKYAGKKLPYRIRLLTILMWSPKTKKANIRMSIFMMIFFLGLYVALFANSEAKMIKSGHGEQVELRLADSDTTQQVTLLGTTNQFVIVYAGELNEAMVYQIESVHSFKPVEQGKQPTRQE